MIGGLTRWSEQWSADPTVEAVGWSLVHFLWQGAVLALLLFIALQAMRRRAPAARYAAACAALLAMASTPVATFLWLTSGSSSDDVATVAASGPFQATQPVIPRTPAPVVEAPTAPASAVDGEADLVPHPAESAPASAVRAAPPARTTAEFVRGVLPWLVVVWLLGVMLLSFRLGAGWFWVRRLRRCTSPATAEWSARLAHVVRQVRVSRPVRLVESALVEVPAVIGWLRPVILLPAGGLIGLTPRQLDALLAHELAHVRRHDFLTNLGQTVLETLLFYHPAVWWVSRTMRAEREACCDETAASVCGGRLEYARALATLEESRGGRTRLALAAADGPLLARIRRLIGGSAPPQANRSAWWIMAAVALGGLVMLASHRADDALAQPPSDEQSASSDQNGDREKPDGSAWGPESDGLRARLVVLPADADAEAPDLTRTADSFVGGEAVTLGVELKNVGDAPVTLLGVRYGDSYPTHKGKLATEAFAPHLFDLEFRDDEGKSLDLPRRVYLEGMLQLSGASAHEVAPGETLKFVLRPAKFNGPMDYELPPGEYTAQVRYHGPSEEARAKINKHWPDKPQGKAWTGEVVTNEATFSVKEDPNDPAMPELHWGEPVEGLRAAVTFRRRGSGLPANAGKGLPLNSVLDVTFHIENVSEEPITLVSETWRQDDQMEVTNAAGEPVKTGGSWYSGWPVMVRWTLQPGQTAELSAANFGIAADKKALETFEHPVGRTLVAEPGRYNVQYTIRIGSIQSRNDKGEVVVPGKGDWTGELVTGKTPLILRERTPEDDAQSKTEPFVGRVEFVSTDGTPIDDGIFTVHPAGQREEPTERAIHAGVIEVPDLPPRPATISVRAPGFEHALFYDVMLSAGETTRLELKPAKPTRFRLISAVDGNPVAGAKVRFFNKSSDKASAGPYPMQGFEGPVWATSQEDGTVLLDSLQQVSQFYEDLGDAVYVFYIEPDGPGLTGRLLGGVKAGMDLGDVTLGPPLEVRGEVHATPEVLDRFAAEWDQPFKMETANPDAAWDYAVSQKLETRREGDKLTFHLTGLHAGRLRFVSNFGPHPHSVSHTYTRRDPQGTDVVVEVELTESIDKLVLTPLGRLPADEERE